MSGFFTGSGVLSTVLGTRVLAERLTNPDAGTKVLSGVLPMTGLAVGVYIAIGIGLIVIGALLRRRTSKGV